MCADSCPSPCSSGNCVRRVNLLSSRVFLTMCPVEANVHVIMFVDPIWLGAQAMSGKSAFQSYDHREELTQFQLA